MGAGEQAKDQQLFRDLVETSQDLIWQCDADGRYIYLNPAWEETMGYPVAEMLGRPFSEFQTPEQAARDMSKFAGLMKGEVVRGYETVHLHKDGRPVHLVFSAIAHYDAEGRIAGTRGTAHDITESRRIAEALRRSDEGYRRLFEDMPLAFCTADRKFRFLEANAAFQKLFGCNAQELRSMSIQEFTHEQQAERDRVQLQLLARGEIALYQTTKRYRAKGGRRFWGLVTVSAVRDEHGALLNYLAGVADITEVKSAEQLLEESQRIAQIGSYDFDPLSGRWTSSRTLDRIFGIDEDYARDLHGWLALVHAGDRVKVERYLTEHVLGRGLAFDRQYRLSREKEGEAVWVHGRGELTFDDEGQPIRLLGTIQDITASRRAQQALRTSERKYRTLVDSLNVGVFHSSLDGRFLHANQATARMAGFDTVEEFANQPASTLYTDEGERRGLIQALRRDGAFHGLEVTSVRRDGSKYPIEMSAVLLRDERGEPESILGVVTDISERKKAEEVIQRTQHLESIGVLAGGIAHDFNNLLTGVFGFIELAEQVCGEEEVKDLLRSAGEPLTRARALTQQLLTFAKGG